MPLLPHSAYRPPLPLRNGHVQTLYPALFRTLPAPHFRKERIHTPDGDFIDLDWLEHDATSTHPRQSSPLPANAPQPPLGKPLTSDKPPSLSNTSPSANALRPPLIILTHGLEGNTSQSYMRGMARALFANGWDVLAWNFRGCGGEPNLQLRSYHSGATDDLECVIAHACAKGSTCIGLVGFSLGGNIVLKYLGERTAPTNLASAPSPPTAAAAVSTASALAAPITATAADTASVPAPPIRAAVTISVPCDLSGSTAVLERRSNRIYMERFLKTLRRKIREKHQRFPNVLDITGLEQIRSFREFDDRYTAPLHGFRDADHYWHACSCLRVIEHIAVPTLLLNAADDPFLSPGCFPTQVAQSHPFLHLEIPRHGGHVGFVRHKQDGLYYSELRACAFLAEAFT